jgi:Zn-dependent protease with chaperone function
MAEARGTSISKLGWALVAACCIGGWVVAAVYLWRTTVPSLDLGGFDEHAFFSARELARAHDYEAGSRALWAASNIATIAALVVLVRVLPRSVRSIGLGRIGTAVIVGMVVLTTLFMVTLPFGIAALWWQHHWGLGPFDVFSWLVEQRFTLGSSAVFAMATIVVLVALAARFRRNWWIPGAAAFVALAALLTFTSGWLATVGTHPIRSEALQADVDHLKLTEGVNPPVRVQKVSDWTSQANAFATGFGPSTRVVLWDTLLDGRFSDGEVNVVVAHELAHVKSNHVPKSLAWFVLFAFPALFVVAEVTRRRGGLRDPANLPLAVLTITVVSLLAAPLQNAVSRRYEAEADWRALLATNDPQSMTRLFEGFQETSLQDPNPPSWAYLWLETHPTLMQRIAMAKRFEESGGTP